MPSQSLTPELYVSDFERSLEFYVEVLGFAVEFQRTDPRFAFLSYQGSTLMIQEIDSDEDMAFVTGPYKYPFGRGINFQIKTADIEPLSASLAAHDYPVRRAAQDSWYRANDVLHGHRQVLVQDPDGYLWRFAQDLGVKPA